MRTCTLKQDEQKKTPTGHLTRIHQKLSSSSVSSPMTAVSRCPDARHPRPCRSIFRELRIVETRPASSLRRSILLVFLNGPICDVHGDRVSVFLFCAPAPEVALGQRDPRRGNRAENGCAPAAQFNSRTSARARRAPFCPFFGPTLGCDFRVENAVLFL